LPAHRKKKKGPTSSGERKKLMARNEGVALRAKEGVTTERARLKREPSLGEKKMIGRKRHGFLNW